MQSTFNVGLAYSEYRSIKFSYINAAIVAFIMSSYFVVGYLAGDLLFWAWDIAQAMNGGVGVGICLVMTSYQFILYARGDVKGGKKATIVAVCVAVGFSLLSEVGQGMERDHVRMETRSIESPTYKAIVGQIGTTPGVTGHPYSTQLATAKMKLARCQKNVSTGLWKDCVESSARLASVQDMIQQHYQQNQQRSVTLANTAKTMEKDESNYHPLVNLIKESAGLGAIKASFILSLILISFFEYAFHYLGRQLAVSRDELLAHGYDVTQKTRKIPLLFRTTQNKESLPSSETWNDELSKSGIDSPADEVLNTSGDPEQIKRIVETGKSVPDSVSDRTVYSQDTSGGNDEDTTEKSDSDRTVYSQDTSKDVFLTRFYPALYLVIKQRIISGDIRPTIRPVTDAVLVFLRENGSQVDIKSATITKPMRQTLAGKVLRQLEEEGIVTRNPEGGVGKPKYILAGSHSKLGTKEHQLDMPLRGEGVHHA